MIRIIRLKDQRRVAAQIALSDADQGTGSAIGDHYLKRASVDIYLDAVILGDLSGDGLAKIGVALAAAVMVLAGGDYRRRFSRELRVDRQFGLPLHQIAARRHKAGDRPDVRFHFHKLRFCHNL